MKNYNNFVFDVMDKSNWGNKAQFSHRVDGLNFHDENTKEIDEELKKIKNGYEKTGNLVRKIYQQIDV